ncbi:phosphotransferase [Microbacterium sp. NPDC055903]
MRSIHAEAADASQHVVDGELALLRDALDIDGARAIGSEPLGDGAVAGFAVGAEQPAQIYYVDTSGLAVTTETGLVLADDEGSVTARIWLHPADPHLPTLATIAFPHALELVLERLGIAPTGDAELIGYRPGRRAVLRVTTDTGTVWLKAVRPSRIDRVVRAHQACADAGLPIPLLRGWSAEGLIVLDPAEGEPAADVAWEPSRLLQETDRLRESIRALPWSEPSRPLTDRLDWYRRRIGEAPAARALLERVAMGAAAAEGAEREVVHGDLHFGQLFLSEDRVSGFIDVDTLGVGTAAEDSAAFIAHAIASARRTAPENAPRVWRLADMAIDRWGGHSGLRPFIGIHLIGHALSARLDSDPEGEADFLSIAARILDGGDAEAGPG